MDYLDSLRLFVRVVERASFTLAAADLNLSKSSATDTIRKLELRLGTKLLDRTTRHVAPTPDGLAFYHRCVVILADLGAAEAALQDTEPNGLLRVDAHGLMTQTFLLPHLPAFLSQYPRIDIEFGQTDRLIDIVREGVDCAIRVGAPSSSELVLRPLGMVEEVTVASPAYLHAHGVPQSIDALQGHLMVGFCSSRTGKRLPLEFTVGGEVREVTLPCRVSANHSDTSAALARLGLGLLQAPRYRFADDLARGTLVEVLPAHKPTATPVSALFSRSRQLTPRLRVFLEWAAGQFAAGLGKG